MFSILNRALSKAITSFGNKFYLRKRSKLVKALDNRFYVKFMQLEIGLSSIGELQKITILGTCYIVRSFLSTCVQNTV